MEKKKTTGKSKARSAPAKDVREEAALGGGAPAAAEPSKEALDMRSAAMRAALAGQARDRAGGDALRAAMAAQGNAGMAGGRDGMLRASPGGMAGVGEDERLYAAMAAQGNAGMAGGRDGMLRASPGGTAGVGEDERLYAAMAAQGNGEMAGGRDGMLRASPGGMAGAGEDERLYAAAAAAEDGAADAGEALPAQPRMTPERLREAVQTLQRFKAGKTNLEARIVDNEQWWKLRHWEQMRAGNPENPRPASGWLFNCILSKHADAMDSYPEPNVLPREEGDREEAKKLTEILPVVLEQNGFEGVYSDVWWYKLKAGTGVYGVFWDKSKLGGLGDISVRKVDLLNLFWEPGVGDLQQSSDLFCVQLVDEKRLRERYPQLEGKSLGSALTVKQYCYEDNVDTSGKALVVDWYYRTGGSGRQTLQLCKFVGESVLYASEDDPALEGRGLYDHGRYPFVLDVLFPEEGSPAGFGYIDVCKDPQKQIDLMNQAMLMNTLAAATPRYFKREDGGVSEDEFSDWTKPFVHYTGALADDNFRQITVNPLSGTYVAILNNKIDELKETSGNRDVNNGGSTGGVTAASGIAALQEQSGKLSRDMIKQSYRAYRDVVILCIELIRQFYDVPRQYRITGGAGEEAFAPFSNAGLRPQPQSDALGNPVGYRVPVFDLSINAQRESAYSKLSQNELALQFYGNGFFNPQLADQALACLDMMDFRGKEQVSQRIAENGTMQQQIDKLQQQLLSVMQMLSQSGAAPGGMAPDGMASAGEAQPGAPAAPEPGRAGTSVPAAARGAGARLPVTDSLGSVRKRESRRMEAARANAQSATRPR